MLTVGVASFSFSQASTTFRSPDVEQLEKSKSAGVFNFVLPSSVTADEVNTYSLNYTDYFIVKFNEETNEMTVVMKDNTRANREIMIRLMVALELRSIMVGTEEYKIQDYFTEYILPNE